MISITDYFMGRDVLSPLEMTRGLTENAVRTVARVNRLLEHAAEFGVVPGIDRNTGTQVASGWRPRSVNDRTSNAAKASNHIVGLAVDLQDTPARDLARFCVADNGAQLAVFDLYMEDPRWTLVLDEHGREVDWWVHLQIVPPKSGRRIYIPSARPALCAAIPGQVIA